MELIVVLHNIRSTYNVGAILRSLEGFGGKMALFSGYTPYPGVRPGVLPHLAEKMTRQIAKTALGAEKLVNCKWSGAITTDLNELKKQGYKLVGLENHVNGSVEQKVYQLNSPEISAILGDKIVLVLGEEVSGIPKPLYELLDCFLEIPMKGQKESFNVSVAAGIALYQLLA